MLNLNAKNTVNTMYNFKVLCIVFIFLVFYYWKTLADVTRKLPRDMCFDSETCVLSSGLSLHLVQPSLRKGKKKKKTKKNNWSLWFSDSLALKELRHRQGKFTAWYFSHIHLRWAGLYLISDCFPELQWYSAELLHEEYEVRGYSPEQS